MNRLTLPLYKFLALLLIGLHLLTGCDSNNETNAQTLTPLTESTSPTPLPINTEIKAIKTVEPSTSNSESTNTEHYWLNVANTIQEQVNESLALAKKGETKLAMRKMGQAYFQQFEGSKMETALRVQISPKHMLKVEKLFGDFRKSIKAEAEGAVLKQQANAIIEAVHRDANALDKAGIQADLLEGM
jgi:hypothetical protein